MFGPSSDRTRKAVIRELQSRGPALREAIYEDARVTALHRGERSEFRGRADAAAQVLRLIWVTDAFAAHVLYRLRCALLRRGVPLLPLLLHKLSMASAQVSIGDPVVMGPGVYIVHGQVVIDGITEVGRGCVIGPWTTIGLVAGNVQGPTLGQDVAVGTGAKVLGPVRVGDGAVIGANAAVTRDVEPGSTVVGVPARARGNDA